MTAFEARTTSGWSTDSPIRPWGVLMRSCSGVGERMGSSRERVRQVECQGKDRLRRWFLRRQAGTRACKAPRTHVVRESRG